MNQAYANTGITWVLASTSHTTNADWFNGVGPDESSQTDMKSSLRVGGAADLNVYTVGYVLHNHLNDLTQVFLFCKFQVWIWLRSSWLLYLPFGLLWSAH